MATAVRREKALTRSLAIKRMKEKMQGFAMWFVSSNTWWFLWSYLFSKLLAGSLGFGLCFLGQQNGLDVGQDSALSNGHSTQKLVQLLVVPDGQLQMPGNDPGLLVVTSGIASQLENLSGQVLHDGGQVDGSSGANTFGIVALPEETMNPSHRELKSGTRRPRLGLALGLSSFAAS